MFNEFFNDVLLPALLTVLGVAVTTLTTVAIQAINKWADKQKEQWKASLMRELGVAAANAVASANQTFVDDIRASMDDGSKLTREDARAAATLAFNIAWQQLSQSTIEALSRLLGNMDEVRKSLNTLIEAEVGRAKTTAVAALPPTITVVEPAEVRVE